MNENENKNITVSKLFLTLVRKHSFGSKKEFAKLINVSERWLYDKCNGKEGLPAEKLFEILKGLGYCNLAEIFFDFNSEISQKRYNTKEAKKEGLERRANPIKKPKLKSPKDDVTPKRIKKRPMRRLKPKKSS
jgi:hypothetical protein